MKNQLDITLKTKVGELLDAYPGLEDVLMSEAPVFKKLKNPVLRKTVTKVTTIEGAAKIAGIDGCNLVLSLRKAAGLDEDSVPVETPVIEEAADEQ